MQQDASSPMATVGAETLQRDASAWQAAASDSATPPAPQALCRQRVLSIV